jgi:hypothetical protein
MVPLACPASNGAALPITGSLGFGADFAQP